MTPKTKITLKGYLVTGLLIWLPITVTLWMLGLIIGTLDQTLNLLPETIQPDKLIGFHVPGLGVILCIIILLATGMLGANVLGRRLLNLWDRLLLRIPVVKSIYTSVKQVSDTLFSDNGQAFKKTLLVRWPHQRAWCVAFQTGIPSEHITQHAEEEMVSVYVPTTPNPTSGYFIIVPKRDTRELDMSVDEALKYVISMGVVTPTLRHPEPLPQDEQL